MNAARIYLDAGSTNTRAWLVEGDRILATRTASIGVRDSAREGSTARLRAEIHRLIAELSREGQPSRVMAAGMITSSLGVFEVPHLQAPAGAAALARGLVKVEAPDVTVLPLYFVPGVRTGSASDDVLDTDLMRGEETLAIGLVATGRLSKGGTFLNCGSHWKLVATGQGGEIVRSRTSLGGEAIHAIQTGTILASALPEGPLEIFDPMAVQMGAASARASGLMRALFAVRLVEQRGERSPAWRFSFLAGACVSSDLDALLAEGFIHRASSLAVTGPARIPDAWATLLREAGCEASVVSASEIEASFIAGLSAIESIAFESGVFG